MISVSSLPAHTHDISKPQANRTIARSLDEGLQTRQGSVRTFLILARYASRTVYEEKLDRIRGTIFYPPNLIRFFRAWFGHLRVEAKLSGFEWYLTARRILGMKPLEIGI